MEATLSVDDFLETVFKSRRSRRLGNEFSYRIIYQVEMLTVSSKSRQVLSWAAESFGSSRETGGIPGPFFGKTAKACNLGRDQHIWMKREALETKKEEEIILLYVTKIQIRQMFRDRNRPECQKRIGEKKVRGKISVLLEFFDSRFTKRSKKTYSVIKNQLLI